MWAGTVSAIGSPAARRREGGLGIGEPAIHSIGLAGQGQCVGTERAEEQIGPDGPRREPVEPASQRRELRVMDVLR